MATTKRKVQVTFTDVVYRRLARMAELRGVSVATYVGYVAAEQSMASDAVMASLSSAIPNAIAQAVNGDERKEV